jgi:hypothetical protein
VVPSPQEPINFSQGACYVSSLASTKVRVPHFGEGQDVAASRSEVDVRPRHTCSSGTHGGFAAAGARALLADA